MEPLEPIVLGISFSVSLCISLYLSLSLYPRSILSILGTHYGYSGPRITATESAHACFLNCLESSIGQGPPAAGSPYLPEQNSVEA